MKRFLFSVLVSELMLQQTQVATVIRYYETWMKVNKTYFMNI
jgi:adenine-specific DNA glycosylase